MCQKSYEYGSMKLYLCLSAMLQECGCKVPCILSYPGHLLEASSLNHSLDVSP
jgi:hypothetical protein